MEKNRSIVGHNVFHGGGKWGGRVISILIHVFHSLQCSIQVVLPKRMVAVDKAEKMGLINMKTTLADLLGSICPFNGWYQDQAVADCFDKRIINYVWEETRTNHNEVMRPVSYVNLDL